MITPAQEAVYARLSEAGFEYSHTEHTGDVFVQLKDHSADTSITLSTWVIERDGRTYQVPQLSAAAETPHPFPPGKAPRSPAS